jgi:serine/threonine protein kinase
LGEGSFSRVYKCYDEKNPDSLFAVKEIKLENTLFKKLKDEIYIMKRVKSVNVA